MKVITIESEAYKRLVRQIEWIYFYVKKQAKENATPKKPNPSEIWIGNDEAAKILEISTRTLQRLRSKGEITYSIRGGKARYTLQEVNRLIAGRVVRNDKTKGGKS
ncbi:MAG: helix-turn-helix domain-containing protein [Tannerellaceae bacterium]|jgi:hypothetical protein|nr:helix-turn-helix domain-containing protein [Tannerellaceae bacterium]